MSDLFGKYTPQMSATFIDSNTFLQISNLNASKKDATNKFLNSNKDEDSWVKHNLKIHTAKFIL